jgi:hypothetical protein
VYLGEWEGRSGKKNKDEIVMKATEEEEEMGKRGQIPQLKISRGSI